MSSADTETSSEPRQRLFFALWPDDGVRARLDEASVTLLGKRVKRVPAANLHLTLAFAGSVTASVRQCLEIAAAGIRCPSFELSIGHTGHWPRPRIFWAGPAQTPPALWSLAGLLKSVLGDCGLQAETRAYQPHITLARKIAQPPQAARMDVVAWSIRHFCLVESVTGPTAPGYKIIATWELEG